MEVNRFTMLFCFWCDGNLVDHLSATVESFPLSGAKVVFYIAVRLRWMELRFAS